MKTTRALAGLPIAVALAGAVALLAGGAAATSHFSLEVAPFQGPIPPLGPPPSVPITARLTCGPEFVPGQINTIMLEAVALPAWVTATISPTTLYFAARDCLGHEFNGGSTLNLAVAPNAPAFQPAQMTIRATAEGEFGTATAEAVVRIVPGFFSLYSVSLPTQLVRAGENLPVRIDNLGNAPARFSFVAEDVPPGVFVDLPDPVVVDSPLREGAVTTATLELGVRGKPDASPAEVTLRIDSTHAGEPPADGNSTRVTFRVESGALAGVPAPALPALVVIGAAAAAVLRRRL